MEKSTEQIKRFKRIIILLSIILPVVIGVLFRVEISGLNTTFLPPVYATINGVTALLLIAAIIAIKKGNRHRHENLIKGAMICSTSFLLMYTLYHITNGHTEYGGTGALEYIYYILLISHIILSVVVIPLVLFSYLRAWLGDFQAHKKITRYAFPVWLYVAISGVVVYLMISPFY